VKRESEARKSGGKFKRENSGERVKRESEEGESRAKESREKVTGDSQGGL
jgi:hypothetical protein